MVIRQVMIKIRLPTVVPHYTNFPDGQFYCRILPLRDRWTVQVPTQGSEGPVTWDRGNTLVIRYNSGSWEFQYALKLAPHSIEPRNNLGLVMEKVGRLDQAIKQYEEALAISPENLEVIGHLARSQIKAGHKDSSLQELLEKLALSNERDLSRWARQQLLNLGKKGNPP